MSSAEKPEILPWNLEIWEAEGPAIYEAQEVERWAAATRFAVVGRVDDSAYLYVVEKDATRLVTVLAVVDVEAARLTREAEARIPQAGVWLSLAEVGMPYVIGSSRQLTRDEIAVALGGHSPPPSPTTGDTSKTGKP